MVVAAGIVAWASGGAQLVGVPATDGPLKNYAKHGQVLNEVEGARFTDDTEVLRLSGDKPARLLKVRSVGGEDALRQIGVIIAGPERRWAADC